MFEMMKLDLFYFFSLFILLVSSSPCLLVELCIEVAVGKFVGIVLCFSFKCSLRSYCRAIPLVFPSPLFAVA